MNTKPTKDTKVRVTGWFGARAEIALRAKRNPSFFVFSFVIFVFFVVKFFSCGCAASTE